MTSHAFGEPVLSSRDLWHGLSVEEDRSEGGDLECVAPPRDLVLVHSSGTAMVQGRWEGGPWRAWTGAPQQVSILPAGRELALRWQGACAWIVIEIRAGLLARACGRGHGPVELRPVLAIEDPLAFHLATTLSAELRAGNPRGEFYAISLGSAFAAHIAATYGIERGEPDRALPPARLRRITQYIDQRLDSGLTRAELAAVAGMSPHHFARLFKQSTGDPPHRYILTRRIERAAALLRDASVPIADVALRSGFSSQSSFTTAFRRVTRMTPAVYRAGR